MRRAILALALGWLTLSCAGLGANDELDAIPIAAEARPASDGGTSLVVELGTGAIAFEPVAPRGAVDVVPGPQGGQHIWTSVRIADPSVERAIVNLSARFEQSGALAGAPTAAGATFRRVGAEREASGLQNLIADPAAVRGQVLALRAEIMTEDGRVGVGTLSVVPR